MLTGRSPHDFLDHSAALQVLAAHNNTLLGTLAAATAQARGAQHQAKAAALRARSASDAAANLLSDIAGRKKALNAQIAKVKHALAALAPAARQTLASPGDQGVFVGGLPALSAPRWPRPWASAATRTCGAA
ncbi:MAG: hypothetical protein ACRDRL_00755 [Sciscionella sp.]